MIPSDSFAIRLMRAQSAECLTMAELSREAGIHHATISQYFDGTRGNPTMDTLVRLATVLKVSTDYLCGLEQPSPKDKLSSDFL
jgi:transcriptional regulator with XRE-family HTH domain